MTLLVGILCKDGVVVASDSAATFGNGRLHTIGQQAVKKVVKVNDHILYMGTGAVGIAQLITDKIKSLWDTKSIKGTPEQAMNLIGLAIAGVIKPYFETAAVQQQLVGEAQQSLCKSMIALPVDKRPCLFTFDCNGAPERATSDLPFVSLGSGQLIADPFLAYLRRVLWTDMEPTLAEGRLAAAWTIDHVRRTNPGGVGGDIQLACLVTKPGELPIVDISQWDGEKGIQEHLQRIESAEKALVNELRGIKPAVAADIPVPPAQVAAALAQAPMVVIAPGGQAAVGTSVAPAAPTAPAAPDLQ